MSVLIDDKTVTAIQCHMTLQKTTSAAITDCASSSPLKEDLSYTALLCVLDKSLHQRNNISWNNCLPGLLSFLSSLPYCSLLGVQCKLMLKVCREGRLCDGKEHSNPFILCEDLELILNNSYWLHTIPLVTNLFFPPQVKVLIALKELQFLKVMWWCSLL